MCVSLPAVYVTPMVFNIKHTLLMSFGEHPRENLDLNIVLISWQPTACEVWLEIEDMLGRTGTDVSEMAMVWSIGLTLSNLPRKEMISAHSFTASNDCRFFSTSCTYFLNLESFWNAVLPLLIRRIPAHMWMIYLVQWVEGLLAVVFEFTRTLDALLDLLGISGELSILLFVSLVSELVSLNVRLDIFFSSFWEMESKLSLSLIPRNVSFSYKVKEKREREREKEKGKNTDKFLGF